MQAASSAKRTCSESRSTSLCTATVLMPISLQVQMMRHAISPRFAIRIFLNLRGLKAIRNLPQKSTKAPERFVPLLPFCGLTLDTEKRLPVLDGLTIFDVNLNYFPSGFRLNLIHELHGFDDAYHRLRLNTAANLHKRLCSRRCRTVERAHNRRRNNM